MSDPAIYVIPEAYYGGAAPKQVVRKEHGFAPTGLPSPAAKKSARKKWIFIAVIGGLFLMVVGGSVLYFTRGLRQSTPTPAPVSPPVSTPPAVNDPPIVPSPEISVSPQPQIPPTPESAPSSDADNDGLTLLEEGLYGSQETVPDTDSDGFLDGHEVVNLYNPSGIAPERLEATEFVTRFTHSMYSYDLLYPKTWQVLPDSAARDLSFQSATGESIAVSVIDNPEHLTARAYAASNAPQATVADWTSNKANVRGVLIEEANQLRGVFEGKNFLYIAHYSFPLEGVPAYRRTFEMMLNSFRIAQ